MVIGAVELLERGKLEMAKEDGDWLQDGEAVYPGA